MMKSESEIIRGLRRLFPASRGKVGIGDDAAILEEGLLVSTDACVEGVHFLKGEASWGEVAYKLFASNGSDMAAMGGHAQGYFLSLGMPLYWTDIDLASFTQGVQDFLADHPAELLGGDIVRSPLFFGSVTVVGKSFGQPWMRTGAQTGDHIYVTGTLGCSRLYLNKILGQNQLPLADEPHFRERHHRPSPRSLWAEAIARRLTVHAAMDISDGFTEDLGKLCAASEKGFFVEAERIPLAEKAIGSENLKGRHSAYLKEALIGGEDYELIIVSPDPPEVVDTLGLPLTKVGVIIKEIQNRVLFFGKEVPAEEFKGYSHS